MASNPQVLKFPVLFSCPTCNRPCSEDDLSMCLRCGQQYCQQDTWECACDRDAADMVARAPRRGFLQRIKDAVLDR